MNPLLKSLLATGIFLTTNAAISKEKIEYVSHPANQPVQVTLNVYPKNDKVGRSTGIYSHYRPGFDFDGGGDRVWCELILPVKDQLIEPGASGTGDITCMQPFKTIKGLGHFKYYEGITLVGDGKLN
jgi:hypothetical protein